MIYPNIKIAVALSSKFTKSGFTEILSGNGSSRSKIGIQGSKPAATRADGSCRCLARDLKVKAASEQSPLNSSRLGNCSASQEGQG